MDVHIRGLLEREIDAFLGRADEFLEWSREFKPIISNEDDMTLGFVVGMVLGLQKSYTGMILNREPTNKDFSEGFELLKRRAPEMMSAIRKELT